MARDHATLLKTSAAVEHELKAYKLARRLEQRGLSSDLDFEAKVAQLVQLSTEKLATAEQAVEMAAGGFRLGTTAESEDNKVAGSSSQDPLDAFIVSQAAYT
jgi:hypothetical protein